MHKKINIVSLLFLGCLFMTVLLSVGCGKQDITFQSENSGLTSESEQNGISGSEDFVQETVPADSTGTDVTEADLAESGANTEPNQSDILKEKNPNDADSDPSQSGTAKDQIYVQVNGAVKYPGVYKLQADARVFEAVECAGGMTDEAATEAVNQAEGLTDGQMITIYTREEWQNIQTEQKADNEAVDSNSPEEKDDRVNINTADIEKLCSIPGVGQVRAESIISYRQEQGDFKTIEDIKNVPGIKDGLFKKIKNKIKI